MLLHWPCVPVLGLPWTVTAPNIVVWGKECQDAFGRLKGLLCSKPVLRSPDFDKEFILQTDVSDSEIGAILSQMEDGQDHPVGYFSKKLLPREERYSTVENECLAIRLAVEAFRVYLLSRNFRNSNGSSIIRMVRAAEGNQPKVVQVEFGNAAYYFKVVHRAGSANQNADSLSRLTTNELLLVRGNRV